MGRERSRGTPAFVIVVLVAVALFAESWIPAGAQTTEVNPTAETEPVPSSGDAADDPAIWVHPSDPSLSLVIGTDKEGGLAVYDLSGRQLQYLPGTRPNNVDIRHAFSLGGQSMDLVVASERDDDVITVYRVDPQSRQLAAVGAPIATGMDIYGICTYRSPVSGNDYVFVTSEEAGPVGQFLISDDGSGGVSGELVRELNMATTTEGCVADNDLGYLYVAEEDVAVWKYSAEPDGGSDRVEVDRVGSRLEDDIEGMTIYYGDGEAGYLIVSSQGSDEFVLYERTGDNRHVAVFSIVDGGGIDGAENTDGIDVISTPLGGAFPRGLFVAQDGENDPDNQNFKLVPWETVSASVNPPLLVETEWSPRGEGAVNVPPPSIPVEETPSGSAWSVAGSAVATAEDDGVEAPDGALGPGTLTMEQGARVVLNFTGLEIPPGVVVRRAHVTFSSGADQDDRVMLSIAAMADGEETEPVTWAPAPWGAGERGAYQQTPDLSRLIAGAVGSGWAAGEPLTLVLTAVGPGGRSATAFDEDSAAAPTLRLEFRPES